MRLFPMLIEIDVRREIELWKLRNSDVNKKGWQYLAIVEANEEEVSHRAPCLRCLLICHFFNILIERMAVSRYCLRYLPNKKFSNSLGSKI